MQIAEVTIAQAEKRETLEEKEQIESVLAEKEKKPDRLPQLVTISQSDGTNDRMATLRPLPYRRSTEPASPSTSSPSSPTNKLSILPLRPRNHSPFSRTHLRSRSTASALAAPPMTRAHSSPIVDAFGHVHPASPLGRPSSPHSFSGRRVSPLRRPFDESSSFASVDIDQTISENSELDLTPRATSVLDTTDLPGTPVTPSSPYAHATFPRARRRPASPLYNVLPSPVRTPRLPAVLHTSTSSPALRSASSPISEAKYNESYPLPNNYAVSTSSNSSIPSTPTSFRSRSPSISSLETIPDIPDAELKAIEDTERDKDAIAKLKAAMEKEGSRRGSFDGVRGRGLSKDGAGSGADKRKRWSVCGAERRGDLDLETIWED